MINKRIIGDHSCISILSNALSAQARYEYGGGTLLVEPEMVLHQLSPYSFLRAPLILLVVVQWLQQLELVQRTGILLEWLDKPIPRNHSSQRSHFADMDVLFAGAAFKLGKNSF